MLEIGVGTGNVLLKVKQTVPDTVASGLDPDRASLATAATKAARCGVDLQLDLGGAGRLPYPDASVDRVLSSFVFHPRGRRSRLPAALHRRRRHEPAGEQHDRRPDLDPIALIRQSELLDVARIGAGTSLLGRHVFYRASR